MATIYDVAKAAGVSPKTVSRVLNGDTPVNAQTRELVEAAMRSLNYVPSSAARSMRSNKTGLIGMITGAISASPDQDEPVGLPEIFLVQGVQRGLDQAGLTLLIADTGGHSDKANDLAHTFLRHRVEGLIYLADFRREVRLPPYLRGTPVVLANCYDADGTPAVIPDDEGGQYALVSRIIAAGHRRIGFLCLPDKQAARALRLRGYQRALEEAGIPFDPEIVLTGAIFDPVHEYDYLWDALDRVLSASPAPTVICCANDKMALRVCALLRQRGLRVGHDISVAGYDDYRVITEHMDPPLTSIQLPYAAMGMRAAEKLLRLINGTSKPSEPSHELVPGPVVWRESVKTITQVVTPFKNRRSENRE